MSENPNRVSFGRSALLALAAGQQVGCTTMIIIIGALLLGLWLDAQTGIKGFFTITLLVLSAPISLYFGYRLALRTANRVTETPAQEKSELFSTPTEREDGPWSE